MTRTRVPTMLLMLCGLLFTWAAGASEDELAKGFARPPDSAKPWAYWWWLDSAATKEGLTKDLEEMKRQGIAGVLLFDAGEGKGSPVGPVFMSTPWREMFQHALREADRLGIEVGVNLCSGWNAGGTWVTPEHAAKELVWSLTQVQGPGAVNVELPKPLVRGNYYRDVAVLAFPGVGRLPRSPSKLTASSSYPNYPPERAADGSPETRWISNGDKPGQGPTPERPAWLLLEFAEPLPAAALYLEPYPDCSPRDCELECSQDGKTFQSLTRFTVEQRRAKTVPLAGTPARFFRLVIRSAYPFGGSPLSWNVQISEIVVLRKGEQPRTAAALKHWELKAARQYLGVLPEVLHEENPETPGERDCESRQVVDLTKHVDAAGRLVWTAPEGTWTVLRFGHTLLGALTKCVSPGAQGYEIDFFSVPAMDLHFAATAEKMIGDAGPLAGKTLKYVHDDSYEVAGPSGLQPTWTPEFRAEFLARRGYDPLPYLPVLARRIVDSREASNRFLWDYRRTIGDLYAANHYRRMRDLAQRHGLGTHPESGGPFWLHIDGLECEGINDIPMGEFWKRVPEPHGAVPLASAYPICDTVRQAASAAHVYGKRLCQAEAFTSMGPNWEEDFFDLKDIGDRAFCAGLTRNVLCFYVHQPRLDVKPGYQWEAAGTHFDRNVTWWDQIHGWLAYLARCQFLLQQGLFVADLCYFYGEDVPSFVPAKTHMRPPLPKGYDCDAANADVLLNRLTARDGRLVLPDGMSYRYLVLPHRERLTMSPTALRKIKELVQGGVTVVGPKPQRAPGLTDYPRCDEDVRKLADELWGTMDGQAVKERRVGQGRIIGGRSLQEVLSADGVPPDLECKAAAKDANLDFIHRTGPGAEIYFVSNQLNRPESAACLFRVSGRQPEIWDAVTGQRWDATDWREEGGRTVVPLEFAPRQSWFVVFRHAATPPARRAPNSPVLETVQELAGPWTVRFDPKWGGPDSVVFDKLEDWAKRPEEGIRHYSGRATYHRTFDLPEALRSPGRTVYLDLGTVKNVAEVRLNGRNLGVVWTAPWRVETTGAVKPTGNALEIDVVNLWPNRLIGDARLPKEKRFTVTNVRKFKPDSPLLPSGLLGPVTLRAAVARPTE